MVLNLGEALRRKVWTCGTEQGGPAAMPRDRGCARRRGLRTPGCVTVDAEGR